MDAELEAWLIERLTTGIEVKQLHPYKYHRRRIYYELHICEFKRKVTIVLERKSSSTNGEKINLKIVELYNLRGRKKEITSPKLIYKRLIFEPMRFLDRGTQNNLTLSGKVRLDYC